MKFINLITPIKVVFFVSFLMSFSLQSFTQNTITGKLFEEINVAADFCKVSLIKSGDSLVFKSTLSDENGSFEFADIEEGMYKISVNREGCKSFKSPDFQVNLGIKELGEIMLVKDVKIANEVSIVVKKPAVTVSAEKVILNVSNMSNLVGLNAFEVLRRTPGVVIDKDNNITLKGKSDVMVFMDGRPSQMSNEALVNLLKGMNAADIESIEVIKNPSAKYDAAGTGGIINILLKKEQRIWK
jgi:iron complex outermembrane recepter protein